MKAVRTRKAHKIRKSGRHAAPSQMQKAAQRAGQAAPAVAIAGALTTGSGVSALTAAPASAATQAPAAAQVPAASPAAAGAVTRQAHLDAAVRTDRHAGKQHKAASQARQYTVRTGDTLSGIAQRFYGHASAWRYLYRVNQATIQDPNVIHTGQVLQIPGHVTAAARTALYQPRHARPAHAAARVTHRSAPVEHAVMTAGSGRVCTGSGGPMRPLNYGAIVTFLMAHGYTGNAAAGIAGNIYQESGGNPESVGSGGGGLIGWTPLPGGYITGNSAADLQTQLPEILRYNQIWAQYIPALNGAASPAAAADIYVTNFERAGIPAAANREAAATAVAAACGL